jgi:hypothetical protein
MSRKALASGSATATRLQTVAWGQVISATATPGIKPHSFPRPSNTRLVPNRHDRGRKLVYHLQAADMIKRHLSIDGTVELAAVDHYSLLCEWDKGPVHRDWVDCDVWVSRITHKCLNVIHRAKEFSESLFKHNLFR